MKLFLDENAQERKINTKLIMNKIEKKFLPRAVLNTNSLVLYSLDDTIEIIHECDKEGVRLLGIDAFFIWEKDLLDVNRSRVQPSLEDSIDFTLKENKDIQNVYQHAIDFLTQKDRSSMFFEIVTE
jgi:hypothetical protein